MVQGHVHMLIAILPKYSVSTEYIRNQEQLDSQGMNEDGNFK